jgi:hypothetical protein
MSVDIPYKTGGTNILSYSEATTEAIANAEEASPEGNEW